MIHLLEILGDGVEAHGALRGAVAAQGAVPVVLVRDASAAASQLLGLLHELLVALILFLNDAQATEGERLSGERKVRRTV